MKNLLKLAPRDPNQYILKYKILKAQSCTADLEEQIRCAGRISRKLNMLRNGHTSWHVCMIEAGMTARVSGGM